MGTVGRGGTGGYAADTADTWNRRPVPVVARLCEIGVAFGWWWLRSQLHKDERRAAADMRKVLVDLGPAFVKIGQALSSRPDVLPPAYLAELELLQDRIPPFSDADALQVIEAELGLPWGAVFSSLSASPVAAASLGQVYKGTLASNGAEVAVKVQRPGVVEAIGRDTFILRNLAAVARKQLKFNTDLPALVDEWAASLFKELDYRREAANATRFAQLFAFMPEVVVPAMYSQLTMSSLLLLFLPHCREAANATRFAQLFAFMPEVVVPTMYSQLTTPRVLVMQWIEGERLRSASSQAPGAAGLAGVAGSSSSSSSSSSGSRVLAAADAARVAEDLRLVEIGVRCSLEQMLEEGFYHADPHPGNLLKTKDGRLAYLDFGMMGEVEPAVRQGLIRATLHLVNREYERLAEDFVTLGLLPPGTDTSDVLPALTGTDTSDVLPALTGTDTSDVLPALTGTDTSDVLPALTGVFQAALAGGLSNLSFGTLSADLGRTMYCFSFYMLCVFQAALAGGVSNLSFGTLSADLGRTMYRFSFRLPPYYTLLVRSLSVLEGIALASDPGYKVLGAAYPWVSRRLLTQDSPELHATLNNLLYDKSGHFQFDRLESLLEQAAKAAVSSRAAATAAAAARDSSSSTGTSLEPVPAAAAAAAAGSGGLFGSVWGPASAVAGPAGQLLGSFLPGLSGITGQQQQQQQQRVSGRGSEAAAAGGPLALVLSPEGRYIRGILEDELAKGLDAAWRLAVDDSLAAASQQLEGVVAALPLPLPAALLPPWLSGQPAEASSSSSSSSAADGRAALLEAMMAVPKLADAGDQAQVDGLSRLATQLAAFSTASKQQQQHMQQQQALQAGAGSQQQQQQQQQLQQTVAVLQWLLSEVQLLSPEARREALSIPLNISSKLASRLAARARQ
ncbi:hypothetical protein OEZ86_002136 [Tetradesmus obliquus]|nr:hypothetical protein OEZ86_002136 [Tetradesmus obliquus]